MRLPSRHSYLVWSIPSKSNEISNLERNSWEHSIDAHIFAAQTSTLLFFFTSFNVYLYLWRWKKRELVQTNWFLFSRNWSHIGMFVWIAKFCWQFQVNSMQFSWLLLFFLSFGISPIINDNIVIECCQWMNGIAKQSCILPESKKKTRHIHIEITIIHLLGRILARDECVIFVRI